MNQPTRCDFTFLMLNNSYKGLYKQIKQWGITTTGYGDNLASNTELVIKISVFICVGCSKLHLRHWKTKREMCPRESILPNKREPNFYFTWALLSYLRNLPFLSSFFYRSIITLRFQSDLLSGISKSKLTNEYPSVEQNTWRCYR